MQVDSGASSFCIISPQGGLRCCFSYCVEQISLIIMGRCWAMLHPETKAQVVIKQRTEKIRSPLIEICHLHVYLLHVVISVDVNGFQNRRSTDVSDIIDNLRHCCWQWFHFLQKNSIIDLYYYRSHYAELLWRARTFFQNRYKAFELLNGIFQRCKLHKQTLFTSIVFGWQTEMSETVLHKHVQIQPKLHAHIG